MSTQSTQIAETVDEIRGLIEDLYVAAAELAINTQRERDSHD
jgi:hypothetical protein